ncbi:MAG: hypothetical protein QM813_00620 [Verrucomicrobiota bacterium]
MNHQRKQDLDCFDYLVAEPRSLEEMDRWPPRLWPPEWRTRLRGEIRAKQQELAGLEARLSEAEGAPPPPSLWRRLQFAFRGR